MEPYGISPEPLDADAITRLVGNTAAGAVITFLGVSRETSPDARNVERAVETLWYEAYETMAVKRLRTVGEEAARRHGLTAAACWHRTGEVAIGQASIVIAVSAPHRGAAFDGCRYVIDEIKRSVPIWKRERFADGEEWVEGYHAGA